MPDLISIARLPLATAAEWLSNVAGKLLSTDKVWAGAIPVDLGNVTGNVALNLASGINFKAAMTGNIVFNSATNAKRGQSGLIELTHSGAARTATITTAAYSAAAGVLGLSTTGAGAVDHLSYYVRDDGKVCLYVSGKTMSA
jgi:hypothetical protein